MIFTAQQIATVLGGTVVGDSEASVRDVAPIETAGSEQLSYICDAKYTPHLTTTGAGVVILSEDLYDSSIRSAATLILVPNAREAMARLLQSVAETLHPRKHGIEQPVFISPGVEIPDDAYIGAFAYIGRNAKIGRGAQIYPQAYVGDNVVIGDNTTLYPQARVYHNCVVGSNCILHSGVTIGADGFGFEPDAQGVNQKIPQIGNVIIEDDVEIGANTCVDRAMMGSTIVRRNAKIDDLVMVAHNVQVGQSTFLCAQTGIAGSTTIGSHCILPGQVGVNGHIHITDNCVFAAKSGVMSSIDKPGVYAGSPAQEAADWRRAMVRLRQMGKK